MCLFSPIGDFFCLQTLPACRHFHEKLFWPFLPAPNTQQMWQQCWQTLFISSPVLLGLSTWFKNLYIVWSPHQCISWNRDLRRLRHAATSRHVDAGGRLCIDWHTLKPCSRQVENLRSVWSWSADIWGTHTHTHTQISCFYREIFILIIFLSPLSGGAESDCPTLLCCSDTIGWILDLDPSTILFSFFTSEHNFWQNIDVYVMLLWQTCG